MVRNVGFMVGAFFVAACWPGPPPLPPPKPATALVMPPVGTFGVYRFVEQDPFPRGPTLSPNMLFGGGPSSGSERWSWGFTGTKATPVVHYLVLIGQPDEAGAQVAQRSGAPSPELPPGSRMTYFGKDHGDGQFVFETVAAESTPLLTAKDLESCKITENDNHDQTKGYDVVTVRPWLELQFNKAGLTKLSTVPKGSALVVAFGDDALSLMWLPEWSDDGYFPPHFPVEGLTDEWRYARARALAAACTARD